jgi:hypothetical protein
LEVFVVRRTNCACAIPVIGFVFVFVFAVVAAAWPAAASAQSRSGRNELTVFAGLSLASVEGSTPDRPVIQGLPEPLIQIFPFPFDFSTVLDGSAEFGARYTRTLTDTLSFGGDFSIAPGHRLTESFRFGCPDFVLCIAADELPGALSLIAPDQKVVSRVVAYHYGANLGIVLARRGTLRPSIIAGVGGVTFAAEPESRTHFALRVGAGLRADTGPLSTHLEVVDVMTADHFVTGRAEHDVHVRVGFGVRW